MNGFGEWQDHAGGPRPHPPLTAVDAGLRDGTTQRCVSGCVAWVWGGPHNNRDIVSYREIPLEYAEPPSRNLDFIEQHARAFTLVFNPHERCHDSLEHYLVSERLAGNWLTPQDRITALGNGRCYEAELVLTEGDPITILAATDEALLAECARQCRLPVEERRG